MNHYSLMNGYFRFKSLWRNRYITRYKVAKLRCLLENIIICLYKYVDLASKFLIKMLEEKSPPSYRFTSTPLPRGGNCHPMPPHGYGPDLKAPLKL